MNHFVTFSSTKASIVERSILNLKRRLFRAFALKGSTRYIDFLPEIVDDYNNTVHSKIKTTPALGILRRNEKRILAKYYSQEQPLAKKIKFKLSQIVRVAKDKGTFGRGYTYGFSNETFRIVGINKKIPVVYKLEDMDGEPILGSWYTEQLRPVSKDTEGHYLISRISKPRKSDGKVKVYWADFPDSKASWEDPHNILPDVK